MQPAIQPPPSPRLPPAPSANVILKFDKPKSTLADYFHAAVGSPTKSSFINAINNGNFTTWPGLTTDLISKHLLPSIPTTKGHMKQEQQHLRSTRPIIKVEPEPPVEQEIKTHDCFLTLSAKEEGTSYSDLTGRYPITSSRGNQYIVVLYDYDTNSIQTALTKTRNAAEIRDVTIQLLTKLTQSGHPTNLHIMDNEASDTLKAALLKYKIAYQLVPPHIHRRNAAERAIQTFKNHFIAVLCTASPKFPAREWDRLLPQTEITMNLLRQSRFNPKLSAYAALSGPFDFNKTPIAPAGTRIVIHEKSNKRATWSPHSTDAWYIGPSLHHYRCVDCYLPATHSTRVADTVEFFSDTIPFPSTSMEDHLRNSVSDILSILNEPKTASPLLPINDDTRTALRQIATIINKSIPLPPPVVPFSLPTPPVAQPRVEEAPPVPAVPRVHIDNESPSPSPDISVPLPRVQQNSSVPSSNHTKDQQIMFPSLLPNSTKRIIRPPAPLKKALPRPVRPRLDPWRADPRRRHTRTTALAQLLQTDYEAHISHLYHPVTGEKESYDSLRAQDPEKWERAFSNEMGRLAQGVGTRMPDGNENIFFIKKNQVPANKKVTYANPVCDFRPLKDDPYRVRLTVGGDRLPYAHDSSSPAASLLDAKLIINSVISTPGSRFISADIKDYFLCSDMDEYEYIRIPYKWIPEEIRKQYNLQDFVEPDGYVYCEVRKGMYGLKQAARLAFEQLVKNLAPHGYYPVRESPGLWKHNTRDIVFTLCVDDFGIKHGNMDDANHLIESIRKKYKCSVDWTGKNYLGLTLEWNYIKKWVDISMPGYIPAARHKFQHKDPKKPQYSPHPWTKPTFGQRIQWVKVDPNSPKLDKPGTLRVQSISGTFLYYARAVDPTMLVALNEIATHQSSPTQDTKNKCDQLLDYAATYPNAKIRYHASDMILMTDTDAAYLVLPKARSRVAANLFLTRQMLDYAKGTPTPNGPILTTCEALRNVVSSAAEAETGGSFKSAQHIIPIKRKLENVFGHPQPKDGCPLITDNLTSQGILTKLIKPRKSKTWDMRYHWLEDRIANKEINLIWKRGEVNGADYFTKHFPGSYHRIMRPKYLLNNLTAQSPTVISHRLRGCVKRLSLVLHGLTTDRLHPADETNHSLTNNNKHLDPQRSLHIDSLIN